MTLICDDAPNPLVLDLKGKPLPACLGRTAECRVRALASLLKRVIFSLVAAIGWSSHCSHPSCYQNASEGFSCRGKRGEEELDGAGQSPKAELSVSGPKSFVYILIAGSVIYEKGSERFSRIKRGRSLTGLRRDHCLDFYPDVSTLV